MKKKKLPNRKSKTQNTNKTQEKAKDKTTIIKTITIQKTKHRY